MRRLVWACALIGGCFTPSETDSDGSSSGATGDGDGSGTSMTGGSASSGSMTSTSMTTDPTATTATTGDPACDTGQECLAVPTGWDGPFAPELGIGGQCDDTSFPIHFAGTSAVWDDTCTCNCAGQTAQTCMIEVLVGGDPTDCTDNVDVADTCQFTLPSGPITCAGDADACFDVAEQTSFDAFQLCSPGVGTLLHPSFNEGWRLCNADDAVGGPCVAGQCADTSQPLCIAATGQADACPADFPNRIEGNEAFSADEVACECECRDPAECAFMTWHEAPGICTGAGGDDDPSCIDTGRVEFLEFVQPAQGCAPLEANPAEPDLPLDQPITLCCTTAL